jgi:polyribonucleotide nucleotidyltransferase
VRSRAHPAVVSATPRRALSPCQKQVALIIGKGGATIRQLQQDSGAQMSLRRDTKR